MNRYRHRLAVCVSLRLYLRPIRWQKSDGFMISNPRKPSRSSKSPSPLQITFALPPSAQAIMSSSSGSRQTASRSVAGRTIVNLLSRMDSGRWKFTDGNCSCSLSATSRYSVRTALEATRSTFFENAARTIFRGVPPKKIALMTTFVSRTTLTPLLSLCVSRDEHRISP